MREHTTERRHAKVSVTLDPALLAAADAYVADHPELDRSTVVDDALRLWWARQQEAALEAQFAGPAAESEPAEREDLNALRRAAAARRLADR